MGAVDPADRSSRRGRRLRAAAVWLTLLVGGVIGITTVLGLLTGRSTDVASPPPPAGEPEPSPAVFDGPWEALPAAPVSARSQPVAVWTGDEMIVWAAATDERDGAAYNPETRTWRALPAAPLTPRGTVAAVWSGDEMLVWVAGTPRWGPGGGAAYDPRSDSWRELPPAPAAAQPHATAVWSGSEMIVWGGDDGRRGSTDGAAYDPSRDRWRELPRAPLAPRLHHAAVWTGAAMVIWGGAAGDGAGTEHFADGAAYDPVSDSWRMLPSGPLEARSGPAAAWTGEELLLFGGQGQSASDLRDGAAFDPDRQVWRRLRPRAPQGGSWDFAWAHDRLFVRGLDEGHAAVYTPGRGRGGWRTLPDTRLAGQRAAVVVTDTAVITWGGQGPDGALATGASLALDELPSGQHDNPPEDDAGEPPPPVVWPGEDRNGAWRDDPVAVAERFGREVLGWEDPRWVGGEPTHAGDGGLHATLRQTDRRWISLIVIPTRGWTDAPDPRRWAVSWVSPPEASESGLSVNVREGRAGISSGWWRPGITSAELVLRYGDDEVRQTVDGRPASFDVDVPFPTDRPGGLLILFRDARGEVHAAVGTTLPPGDFAAG